MNWPSHSVTTTQMSWSLSGESVESSLVVQRNPLRSPELLRNVIKGASFCLRETNPGEDEGEQSHSHEEQIYILAADLLFVAETEQRSIFSGTFELCTKEAIENSILTQCEAVFTKRRVRSDKRIKREGTRALKQERRKQHGCFIWFVALCSRLAATSAVQTAVSLVNC